MTLFDLLKQWLSEQSEFEYVSRAREQYKVFIVSLTGNQNKIILILVHRNSVTTSKGTLNVSNPKFFNLLKKRILRELRD